MISYSKQEMVINVSYLSMNLAEGFNYWNDEWWKFGGVLDSSLGPNPGLVLAASASPMFCYTPTLSLSFLLQG